MTKVLSMNAQSPSFTSLVTPTSLLFVPGDSERKLSKADGVRADALILDLEDAVEQSRAAMARGLVREYLLARPFAERKRQIWVRVNPMQSGIAAADLAEVVRGHPDVILLPKVKSAAEVDTLSHFLQILQERDCLPSPIAICPTLTETPHSLLNAASFQSCVSPPKFMTWGPIDLAAALGATTNRRTDGSLDAIYEFARGLCIVTARSIGAEPIDTICTDYKNDTVLRDECIAARMAGFVGKLAIHPDQVDVINALFMPTQDEIVHAHKVVSAFKGGTGTFGLDGKMYDMPHLVQARTILARSAQHRPEI
ncbi:HpcH/HpaI aldolase/citrate lyase family protein [Caballeronia sp. 15711]|uniref:HpcH/HpaI aldolase/citrate lyase family protein n=1 Tax=Caballeronia sp. 15711 TaxID=3391029 RepID=UPI0039E35517